MFIRLLHHQGSVHKVTVNIMYSIKRQNQVILAFAFTKKMHAIF